VQPIATDVVDCSVGLSVGHFVMSVSLSVCNDREPCKDGWTDRDAVCVVDSGGPK